MRHQNAAWQRWCVIMTTLITFSTISESAKTTCDFESGFCGWKNLPHNDLDWRLMSGSTPSVGTGPTTDHTKGTSSGHYVYIETSKGSNAEAVLASSAVTNSNQMTCKLSMAYHMYGLHIGKLEVIAHSTYRNSSVWSRFGTQRNRWLTTTVDFGSITGSFEIYVRASHSSGYRGDIALDDLSLTNCPPGSPLSLPNSFPNTTCSFETNLCVWSNDVSNDVDWVMLQGSTSSPETGPTNDHTYRNGSGKYIYFEVTGAGFSSHAALVSPEYLKSGSACRMQFAYHFYGSSIGDMDVYFVANGDGKIHNLWSTRGNQGNVWRMRSVFIGPQTDFNIYFKGTHYSGYKGDMALDDISFFDCDPNFTQRPCTKNEFTCLQSKLCVKTDSMCDLHNDCYDNSDETYSSCRSAFQCDFEHSVCGFTNDKNNDSFDWILARGSTFSSQTRPGADHTTGNRNGRYVYINASPLRATGDTAILWSPLFNPSTAANCSVRFFAFMYGQHVRSLVVSQVIGSLWTQLGNITGEQGQDWKKFSLNVPLSGGKKFQLSFEGVHRNGYAGDIAIDDLTLSTSCPKPVWTMFINSSISELSTEYPTTSTPTTAKRFVDPCYPPASSIADGSVRLADGDTPNEGRVEIYHNRQWGTVCDDDWTSTNGRVVCKQLGYPNYRSRLYNRPGSGSIWMDNVRCSASELTLQHCSFRGWGYHNCDHSDDVGVICETASDGDVRLVNGHNANAGNVEIYHNGEWGGVCADGWDLNDANVVCRQLGYLRAITRSYYWQGCGRLWISNINCQSRYYSRLDDCTFSGWGVRSCNYSGYAKVSCDSWSLTTSTTREDIRSDADRRPLQQRRQQMLKYLLDNRHRHSR
ncbi:MAM and LDL-receptor class A domain-containing protein 1-like isoform X2 [Corticium candelabrum]|uniref:MAM and LDL-receptor class A domain-containing protein 1-like isoform X2 n=1 Tax=Corticium candelabrum TaxID=121492 RepID=UPI002E26613A|nr:MAM and LDL-receptor class A domain-containing protein 1-like isoform X2 [Corticium candelabrum]